MLEGNSKVAGTCSRRMQPAPIGCCPLGDPWAWAAGVVWLVGFLPVVFTFGVAAGDGHHTTVWMLSLQTLLVSWAILVNYTGRRVTLVGCQCYELPSLDCSAPPDEMRESSAEEDPGTTYGDRVELPPAPVQADSVDSEPANRV